MLPDGLEFVSYQIGSETGTAEPTDDIYNIGNVLVGKDPVQLTITAKVKDDFSGATITNTASLVSDPTKESSATVTVQDDAPGAPTVDKDAKDAAGAEITSVTKGDEVTYTVEITPDQSGAEVTGFKIEDGMLDTSKATVAIAGEESVTGTWNPATKTYTLTNPASTKAKITVTYTYKVNGNLTTDATANPKGDVTEKPNGDKVVSNTAKVTVYNGTIRSPPPSWTWTGRRISCTASAWPWRPWGRSCRRSGTPGPVRSICWAATA